MTDFEKLHEWRRLKNKNDSRVPLTDAEVQLFATLQTYILLNPSTLEVDG